MASTMKAWVYRKAGEPARCLELDENCPRPSCKPGGNEVLIEVSCIALNRWKAMSNPPLSLPTKEPGVPEFDFSGTIAGGNLEGTGLTIGQEVLGMTSIIQAVLSGHACEYIARGLTAWLALVNIGQLKTRKSKRVFVFVNGGSGDVGMYAIQVAKAFGPYVVLTASSESEAFVKSMGADETVDHRSASPSPSLPAYLSSKYAVSTLNAFDIFLDAIGTMPALYNKWADYLVPGGVYVDAAGASHINSVGSAISTVATVVKKLAWPAFLCGVPRKYIVIALRAEQMGDELREANVLLSSGKIKSIVDSEYPFGEVLKAYERQMSGWSKGKVFVSIS